MPIISVTMMKIFFSIVLCNLLLYADRVGCVGIFCVIVKSYLTCL